MNQAETTVVLSPLKVTSNAYFYLLPPLLAGFLIPLGFAPFHLPGLTILGMAILFKLLQKKSPKQAFYTGFVFGLGFLGLGVSWVYVSIHEYGHLNPALSALITLLFIAYLALYPALVGLAYSKLTLQRALTFNCFLFSALWCLSEFFRATWLGGFPWLLLGFGQTDTALKYLLPLCGIYGVSFFVCLAATCVTASIQTNNKRRYVWAIAAVTILLTPGLLKNIQWSKESTVPQAVAIVQANLSMRNKWDEKLFWQLLQYYKQNIERLIGPNKLIVLPESAIPLPASYISEFLDKLDQKAKAQDSAIILGIPESASADESQFYNAMKTLGAAHGAYLKQHLVPFGEFIPHPLQRIIDWLAFPIANTVPGKNNQPLIEINNHPIATLICYELAYPQLLRKQLPSAEWIVSISDDGWFGHSFAMYQQLQMAQTLSSQMARAQVVANNDGLSSVINPQGEIIASLPAFNADVLEATIYPATGASPWVIFGDTPALLFIALIIFLAILRKKQTTKQ